MESCLSEFLLYPRILSFLHGTKKRAEKIVSTHGGIHVLKKLAKFFQKER